MSPLFIWQQIQAPDTIASGCRWCGTRIVLMRGREDDDVNTQRRCECPLCGWYSSRSVWLSRITGLFEGVYRNTVLKQFSPTDSFAAAVSEIPVAITHAFSESTSTFGRLKDVVEGVMRAHGLTSVLTIPAEPSAAAIVLASNDTHQAMARLAGLADDQQVTAVPVFGLVGVTIKWDGRRALIATSADPEPAKQGAVDGPECEVDLGSATTLSRLLGVYDPSMPDLGELNEQSRTAIIRTWAPPPGWGDTAARQH